MAKATLPTNFVDDIMTDAMGNKRRYNLIQNSDGTVSLEDVTDYMQVGSSFGAAQVNAANKAINESVDKAVVIDNLDDIAANTQSGMVAGALAVAELNSNIETLDGWIVLKHPSGIAIAVRKVNKGAIALVTKMADGVYSHPSVNNASLNLPSKLFTEILNEYMNVCSNGYTLCQISSINTELLNYRIWSSYSSTLDNVISTWAIIGRWK